ncbi:MAG: hypothetical protein RL701_2617, partial [Pseudomonadota bacterium]
PERLDKDRQIRLGDNESTAHTRIVPQRQPGANMAELQNAGRW